MKQNTYYKNVNKTANPTWGFIMYSDRTRKCSGFNIKNKTMELIYHSHNDFYNSITMGNYKEISYKEAMALKNHPVLSQDVNSLYQIPIAQVERYFTHKTEFIGDIVFIKCTCNLGESYSVDGTKIPGMNLDMCLKNVKKGVWKEITKDEAESMLKKEDEIYYYNHKYKFLDETILIEQNVTKKVCYLYTHNDRKTDNHLEQSIIKFVANGTWVKITKDEANEILKAFNNKYAPKTDEYIPKIDEDVYAIQCFFNGNRKFTAKLSEKEARIFRNIAVNLTNFLTENYNLGNIK